MVGLPYANKKDSELISKIQYLDEKLGRGAGSRFLENQCWKAINQSIGRSIRHKNDYATVILLDLRYRYSCNKFPSWIGERVQNCENWNILRTRLISFFEERNKFE